MVSHEVIKLKYRWPNTIGDVHNTDQVLTILITTEVNEHHSN